MKSREKLNKTLKHIEGFWRNKTRRLLPLLRAKVTIKAEHHKRVLGIAQLNATA